MLNGMDTLSRAAASDRPPAARAVGAPVAPRPGLDPRGDLAPSPPRECWLRDPTNEPTAAPDARIIRNAAVRALLAELVTYPKPGLVSLCDSGSHRDMDATTFIRSSLALRRYFEQAAAAGAAGATFAVLNRLGREAEARKLRATGGVNTHRGAVFNLGLLAAACSK